MGLMSTQPPTFLKSLRGHYGFTLIEMLLAITIFSMVIGIIFTSLNLGARSWEKGEKDIEYFQNIRAVSELLYRQIRSAFPYRITPSEFDTHKNFYAFFGETDSLKFISSANLFRLYGGLSLVEFWVDENNGLMAGEEKALVSNLSDLMDISLRDEDMITLIDPHVKELRLRYFDRKEKEKEGEWVQSWNPKDKFGRDLRMPKFVEVKLAFDLGNEETLDQVFIIPIIVEKDK